ncbi:UNVERIFIED_CONTAM: hypothetical protein PYX00_005363 [Menopon gallinae]
MQKHVLCSPSPTYTNSYTTLPIRTQNEKGRITVRKDLISSVPEQRKITTQEPTDLRIHTLQRKAHQMPPPCNDQQHRASTQIQSSPIAQPNVNNKAVQSDLTSLPADSGRLCIISSVEGNYRDTQDGQEHSHGLGKKNCEHLCRNGIISDSDSDSSIEEFFRDTKVVSDSIRLPYTLREDEEILKFVLMGYNIEKTSSISLWRTLETKMTNPTRTYQSLKNRFLRNIKPHIFTKFGYMLDEEARRKVNRKFPDLKKCYKAALLKQNAGSSRSVEKNHTNQCPRMNSKQDEKTMRTTSVGVGSAAEEIHQQSKGVNTDMRVSFDKATNTSDDDVRDLTESENRTFTFSETIEAIPKDSQVVMNLVLSNIGRNEISSQSMLSKEDGLTNKLHIVVTVSAESNINCVMLKKEEETPKEETKPVERFKRRRRKHLRRVEKKYILRLRNCNINNLPQARRNKIHQLMRKLEDVNKARNNNTTKAKEVTEGRVLRSQTRKEEAIASAAAAEGTNSQISFTDLTNCSMDNDSLSSKIEKAHKMYQVVIKSESQISRTDGEEETEERDDDQWERPKRKCTREENSAGKENAAVQHGLLANMLKMSDQCSRTNKVDDTTKGLTKRL